LIKKFEKLQKQKRAILAANFYNYETCRGIIQAASSLNQSVILQLTPASIRYMGLQTAKNIARSVSEEEGVESWLHLDHCGDVELIKSCLDEGFDSVMIDASDKTIEENISITKQVVEMASKYDVNVEAELGHVPLPDSKIDNDKFTESEDAKRFVDETNVTSLAVAIGTKHGFYEGKPKLDINRLKKIRQITDAYLVLHGGSGLHSDLLREAIKNGISKVNVATETKDIFMKTLKEVLKNSDEVDLRKVFPQATDKVKEVIKQKLKIVTMMN
jgi:fructose-bisphosphate aldolase class II/tagatose 1,6-diphosphate aldolase GatY/KbaY